MAKRFHLVTIVGARPQFIKAAALSAALSARLRETLVHTGQHYDARMSDVFFQELQMQKPTYNLGIGSGSHGKQTGAMLIALEKVLLKEKPDMVVVYGDTNSTAAGALAAGKLHIPIAHIEAGMRSFDRTMPEELNRIVTDHLATLLFCPSLCAAQNLRAEGITKNVFIDGDNMFDTLLHTLPVARQKSHILATTGLKRKQYVLATIHRAANTDSALPLQNIVRLLTAIPKDVVFPVHPRTFAALKRFHILSVLQRSPLVHVLPAVGYLDMLILLKNAQCIVTDSGGVQKEAFALKIPCVTLRTTTEWTETVEQGWNVLAGTSVHKALRAIQYSTTLPPRHRHVYGTGKASTKIVRHILRFLDPRLDCKSRLRYTTPTTHSVRSFTIDALYERNTS